MTKTDALKARLVQLACDISNKLRDVPEIDVAELLQRHPEDIVLVDLRSDRERQVSMIPGAISAAQFEANPKIFADKTVVAHCTAGYRSGLFVRKIRKQGIDAVNLRKGILGWCQQHQPLVTPDQQPTRKVHVYSRAWNLVPDDYEAVW
ncbi:MAG: rhodanese-like domain-containing protein [Fuerstiella sp.]